MNETGNEALLTMKEAAEYLGFTVDELRKRAEVGRVKFAKREGNDYWFTMSALQRYERKKWWEWNRPAVVLAAVAIVAAFGIAGYFGFRKFMNHVAERDVRRAEVYLKKKDFIQAAHLLRAAVESAPDNVHARLAYARILGASGKAEEQEQQLLAAYRREPENPVVLENLGMLMMRRGKPDRAREYLEKLLRSKPDHFLALFTMANIFAMRGEDREARRYLDKVLRMRPGFQPAVRLNADIYVNEQKIDSALRIYRREEGDSLEALLNRGILQDKKGDRLGAQSVYREVIARAPIIARAYNNLAWNMVSRGNADAKTREQAFQLARVAYVLNPDDSTTLDTLGWILFLSGKSDLGEKAIDSALKKAPGLAEAHYHKACILIRRHDKQGALKSLKTARKLMKNRNNESVRAIDEMIKNIMNQPSNKPQ